MATTLAVIVAAAILGAAIAAIARAAFRQSDREAGSAGLRSRRAAAPGSIRAPKASPAPGACPLCSRVLEPGERVKSDITPGSGDRIMRIFGCPGCWPPRPGAERTCPVCARAISDDGWAVARYFEKPGRKHVHVLGCTGCRPAGRRSP